MRYAVTLRDAQTGHAAFSAMWQQVKALLIAGHRVELSAKTETRSNAQNRLMWQRLGELARGVEWHGQKLTAEDWKEVLSASLRNQRAVPGINGGFVVLGQRTSRMTVQEMTEMLDLISAFGAQQGVTFEDEQ